MKKVFRCYFPFGGSGGAARGFKLAEAHLFGIEGAFEIVGGFDVEANACSDFKLLTGVLEDRLDAETMTVEDLRRSAGDEPPDVIVITAPCVGASKLISNAKASEPKYQRLNGLALRFVELMVKAWSKLPRLVLFENVPNITVEKRAKAMVAKVKKILRDAGYLMNDRHHDCGELGGLAQHRKRWLMVARDPSRVPPLLYQPPKKRVRGIGEVIGALPIPNDPSAGPMHVLPRLSFLNWVRLALIPAGGDWRDLPGVLVDGAERRSKFRRQHVGKWNEPSVTIAGVGSNGPCAVADPRAAPTWFHHVLRVTAASAPAGAITSSPSPSSGAPSYADPRLPPQAGNDAMHEGKYKVRGFEETAGTVTSATRVGSGAQAVADPRLAPSRGFRGCLGVRPYDHPAAVVTGSAAPSRGAFAVADPRLAPPEPPFDHAYGVRGLDDPSFTVAAGSAVGQGAYAVADTRTPSTPPFRLLTLGEAMELLAAMDDKTARRAPDFTPVIVAEDGTWHRPLTTLELGMLQGLPAKDDEGKPLVLSGAGSSQWRRAIGNMIPVGAASAIATEMLVTLLGAAGGAWSLSSGGSIWVDRGTEASFQ